MILFFPTLDVFRLTLTSGIIPPTVALAPARGAVENGQAWIEPSVDPSKIALREEKKIGVQQVKDCPHTLEPLLCWPQLLPLEVDPSKSGQGDKVPILFDLGDAANLPEIVGEILRLGNDRQSFRWLEGDGGRTLLRVIGPPYYSLLRAQDRQGPRAFREVHAGVWVQLGYTHPLAEQIRPPAGQLLLVTSPRQWSLVPEGRFRDIYEILDFSLPHQEVAWRDVELKQRLQVPLRLAASSATESAELWVLRENAVAQVDELVQNADDHLLARLLFAVCEGEQVIVVRVRPSRSAPPVFVLNGTAFRPYLRLPNLFLPVGQRLHPPLRRDAVIKLLAEDTKLIHWLQPTESGGFTPEALADDAFRPLPQWVDYVLQRDRQTLVGWVQSSCFDFEGFICSDDQSAPTPKKATKKKKDRPDQTVEVEVSTRPNEIKAVRVTRQPIEEEAEVAVAIPEPNELEERLRGLERDFVALKGPLDAEERRALWPQLAQCNSLLALKDPAALCWVNALWDEPSLPAAWLRTWWRGETPEPLAGVSADHVRAILKNAFPHTTDLRRLIVLLLDAVRSRANVTWKPLLGEIQQYLEKHEPMLGIRLLWLGWWAIHELSQGDVLALARARDRLLERLYVNGLTADLDLPAFLRFSSGSGNERFRQVGEHVHRLRTMIHQWNEREPVLVYGLVGTPMYIDLMFAYGLACLGEASESRKLLSQANRALPQKDAVHSWLFQAFEWRILQAVDGKPAGGRLPPDLLEILASREAQGSKNAGGVDADTYKRLQYQVRDERYRIDRLLQRSRILEPHEEIDPYRRWHGEHADDLSRELAALADINDLAELARQLQRLLQPVRGKPRPGEARVVTAALELAPRLGDAFATNLFERVVPALNKVTEPREQARLLQKALFLAGHFDHRDVVQDLVTRLRELFGSLQETLKRTDEVDHVDSLLGNTFKSLRKLGLRDEAGQLLEHLSLTIQQNPDLSPDAPPENQARALRFLLHVASGWFYFGQNDRARPILDRARTLLFKGDFSHVDRTALACAYVKALGQAPLDLTLARVLELFRKLRGIHDTYTVNSHYSVSRLMLIEAVLLTLISDDVKTSPEVRRWLDEDEYLIRRRIHHDVKAALGKAGL